MIYGHRLLKIPQGKLKRLTKIEPKKIVKKLNIVCCIFRYNTDCEAELEKGKHTIGSSNINHWKQILKKKIQGKSEKKKAQI